jgi:hypothetical protein
MHPDHVDFRVKNTKLLMNFRISFQQSGHHHRRFMNVSLEGLNPKKASPLFCVGDWIDIPIQSLTTVSGASSQNSYPIAKILTVNLKVMAVHPGSRAKNLAVSFRAAARASYMDSTCKPHLSNTNHCIGLEKS